MSDDLLAAIARVELPTIGHELDDGFCGPSIRPIGTVRRVVGRARTVDLRVPDATSVNEALLSASPGEVLVIQVHSGSHAPVGAVTLAAARAVGIVGIVVDGPITDVRALEAAAGELPVWATGVTARTTKRLHARPRLHAPVTIGDALVSPGDIVAGDEHGVLILAPETITIEQLEAAADSDAAEPGLLERIASGAPLDTLLARSAYREDPS